MPAARCSLAVAGEEVAGWKGSGNWYWATAEAKVWAQALEAAVEVDHRAAGWVGSVRSIYWLVLYWRWSHTRIPLRLGRRLYVLLHVGSVHLWS